jgi:hypothetical protein
MRLAKSTQDSRVGAGSPTASSLIIDILNVSRADAICLTLPSVLVPVVASFRLVKHSDSPIQSSMSPLTFTDSFVESLPTAGYIDFHDSVLANRQRRGLGKELILMLA